MTAPGPNPAHVVHHLGDGNFGKMIGPLPLGAWIAVVGGGFGFLLYSKRKGTVASAASAPTDPTTMPPDSGAGGSGQWQDLSVPTTGGNTTGTITTNDQWETSAINYLIGHGYDPGLADSAIRKYMGGAKLSVSEYALVREALLRLGEPPSPLPAPIYDNPPIPTHPTPGPVIKPPSHVPAPHQPTPPPKPKPTPAPKPAARYYTTVRGDTLWSIAQRYYHNPLEWVRILNANPGKIPGNNPRNLGTGVRLLIP